jgi:hypothetical protein
MSSVAQASYWTALATAIAEDSHENNFSSRRGYFRLTEPDALVLYDNHPYHDPRLRNRQHAELERWCKANGIAILARGSDPAEGDEQPGYTRTILLDVSEVRTSEVTDKWEEILERWTKGLGAN